jgi:hypothetical protein
LLPLVLLQPVQPVVLVVVVLLILLLVVLPVVLLLMVFCSCSRLNLLPAGICEAAEAVVNSLRLD